MRIILTNMAGVTAPPIEAEKIKSIEQVNESITVEIVKQGKTIKYSELEKVDTEKSNVINSFR